MDKEKEQEKIKKCLGENFKTNTGKRIAYNRFILDQWQIITVMYFISQRKIVVKASSYIPANGSNKETAVDLFP